MMATKAYYQGAVAAFQNEVEAIQEAGVTVDYLATRLLQTRMLLADFKVVVTALEQIVTFERAEDMVNIAKAALSVIEDNHPQKALTEEKKNEKCPGQI